MATNRQADLRIVSARFDRNRWALHLKLSDGTEDEWNLLNLYELGTDGSALERLEIDDTGRTIKFVDLDAELTFGSWDDEDGASR
jgi:hypothetical protein